MLKKQLQFPHWTERLAGSEAAVAIAGADGWIVWEREGEKSRAGSDKVSPDRERENYGSASSCPYAEKG